SRTSVLQLPHPSPAPVWVQRAEKSEQPPAMASWIFPSPTRLQLQTSLPMTGRVSDEPISRDFLFSESSILFSIKLLNSANSRLSPIKTAPISRSSLTMHCL